MMSVPLRGMETLCACGHERRAHTGLRMEVNGRCLQCECEQFSALCAETQSEELLERARALIAHVERVLALVAAVDAGVPQPIARAGRPSG